MDVLDQFLLTKHGKYGYSATEMMTMVLITAVSNCFGLPATILMYKKGFTF